MSNLFGNNRRDQARPFVTYYDDATGERIELSYAGFGNWVAKTANLIQDVFGGESGDRVSILLPPHWQTLVWLVACWEAGAVAAPWLDPAKADHVVAGPETLGLADACPGERVALSLRPLGGRFVDPLPAGVLDYGAEAPGQPDRFVPYVGPHGDDTALVVDERICTRNELVAAGRDAATELGLDDRSRLLTDRDPCTWSGIRDALLAPLAAGASLVLCRNLDRSHLPQRTVAERTTHSVL